jgi:RING-box protein 1
MADVEMTDAPTSAPTSAAVVKKKGGAEGEGKEGKKRFEVKKVHETLSPGCSASR